MSEPSFTPGPLHAKRAHAADNTGGHDWCVHDDRNRIVAECFEHVGFSMETGRYQDFPAEANARLYVSSPRLYAALKAIRCFCIPGMNWTDEIGVALLAEADAAIEEATGKESTQ